MVAADAFNLDGAEGWGHLFGFAVESGEGLIEIMGRGGCGVRDGQEGLLGIEGLIGDAEAERRPIMFGE